MRGFAKAAAIACLTFSITLGAAPVAFSQEDGVTLDPGDPAAKEYALPHEEARREAGDKPKAKVKQGSRDSALFGEGVQPDTSTTTDAPTSGTDAAAKAKAKARAKAKAERAEEKRKKAAAAATTPEPTTPEGTTPADEMIASVTSGSDSDDGDGGSSTMVLVGGGFAALFAALLGGFGLRAVRGPRDA